MEQQAAWILNRPTKSRHSILLWIQGSKQTPEILCGTAVGTCFDTGTVGGPKDLINIRILYSGSEVDYKGMPEMVFPYVTCVYVVSWTPAQSSKRL